MKTFKKLYQFRREYHKERLSEKEVPGDPFKQFNNWFEQALKSEKFDPNAMVLSTVSKKNRVTSRVVLLKDYSQEGFLFFGNYDSRKGRDLAENPNASILFYWPEIIRQVRIEGKVGRASSQISDDYFQTRPRNSQIAAVISPQSSRIENRNFLEKEFQRTASEKHGEKVARPENWGGWILKPDEFEFWQGRESRLHDRIVYSLKDGKWRLERLAP